MRHSSGIIQVDVLLNAILNPDPRIRDNVQDNVTPLFFTLITQLTINLQHGWKLKKVFVFRKDQTIISRL